MNGSSSPLQVATKSSIGYLLERAVGVALRQHAYAAVAHQRDRGKRRQRQPLRITPRARGPQADVLRTQQQVGNPQRLASALAEKVQQGDGVRSDVVHMCNDARREQRQRRTAGSLGLASESFSSGVRRRLDLRFECGRDRTRTGYANDFVVQGTPCLADDRVVVLFCGRCITFVCACC